MVVILDTLHTFHLGFFDDYHIPITTNSCLLSYLWQRSGFDK